MERKTERSYVLRVPMFTAVNVEDRERQNKAGTAETEGNYLLKDLTGKCKLFSLI